MELAENIIILHISKNHLKELKKQCENFSDEQLNTMHDNMNNNLLHLSVINNNEEMVSYFLTRNIDVNHKNTLGYTPFDHAYLFGNKNIIELLTVSLHSTIIYDIVQNMSDEEIKTSYINESETKIKNLEQQISNLTELLKNSRETNLKLEHILKLKDIEIENLERLLEMNDEIMQLNKKMKKT